MTFVWSPEEAIVLVLLLASQAESMHDREFS